MPSEPEREGEMGPGGELPGGWSRKSSQTQRLSRFPFG
jgi:hypothetical protein